MTRPDTPQIYVACLAAYNQGILYGMWMDATQDLEILQDTIAWMLSHSPANKLESCEDWAIHDTLNFHGIHLREHESLEKVSAMARALDQYGEAFAAYYEDGCTLEGFEEAYQGDFESEEDFVWTQFEETGYLQRIQAAGLDPYYIDWETIAHDWFINDYFSHWMSFERVVVFAR